MKSKYKGIDSRIIKCCSANYKSIEAGISFDEILTVPVLQFHFLEFIKGTANITQETKSMFLDKESTAHLIKELKAFFPEEKEPVPYEKEYTDFLEWFFDNESKIEGDPEAKHFVSIYLSKEPSIQQKTHWYFDCWDRGGKTQTITIEALNKENAKIIFESKHDELSYDDPY